MTETGRSPNEAELPETQNDAPKPQAGPETAPQPEVAPTETPSPAELLVEALRREAELRDRVLRAVAETENLRRRIDKEKQDAHQYASQKFAAALLPVLDNFQRALHLLTPEARAELPQPVLNMIEGIELTEKELLRVFAQHGIKVVSPKGERFDPHLHQAIAQIPAPAPEGTVVDVAQVGYTIGDRLLRPAMVVVSAGGGAPAVDTKA